MTLSTAKTPADALAPALGESQRPVPTSAMSPKSSTPSPVREQDAPPDSRGTDANPNTIGKYVVRRCLGQGAMGIVYECEQTDLDRLVAVKVLSLAGPTTAEQIRRFEREARAAARLSHPNVVQIFDVGSEAGRHFIVMELVDGVPLSELIGTRYLTLETTLRLLYHVTQALAAAHEQGIVHRDLKPTNILVDRTGRPRIADFGLAKSVSEELSLSGDGDLIGTPRYMSPEQVLSACDELDGRSDLFSLGAVMYEMLAGAPPFDGDHVLAILRKVVDEVPRPLREARADLPPAVIAICERALAKEKEARFTTASEMGAELRKALLSLPSVEVSLASARDEDVLMAFAPPSKVLRKARKTTRWQWIATAGGIAAVTAAVGLWRIGAWLAADSGADEARATAPHVDYKAQRSKFVAEARDQLAGPLRVSQTSSPRDGLKSIIEDLTVLLKQAPDDRDVRKLRGRAYRRAGECLAAVEDQSRVLERKPDDAEAIAERLLANYQLYVLYLGNFNLPHLRLLSPGGLKGDLAALRKHGDAGQRYVADLVESLARQETQDTESLLAQRPAALTSVYLPDVQMLEADLLLRAAQRRADEPADEAQPMLTPSQNLGAQANRALRKGLDADPNHVGLLFIKANSIQKRANWEDTEGEGRDAILRRNRLQFDSAFDRLLLSTLRIGCDTSVARAVLLSNTGRDGQALDQVQEALSCRPTIGHLYAVKAWLRMQTPEDGTHTAESLARIERDFEPAFESSPDDYNPFFIRGLLHAAGGRWNEARRDLRQVERALAGAEVPEMPDHHRQWIRSASGSQTVFLDQTRNVLNELPVSQDRRIELITTLLNRLQDEAGAAGEGLSPDQVRSMRAWAHFALAETYAGQDNKAGLLKQVELALAEKRPDLVPQTFRENGLIGERNEDPEFMALYAKYEPTSGAAAQ